jgi:hypothetical protein
MNINAFFDAVTARSVPCNEIEDTEKAMQVIEIVEYSDAKTCGDVDFSQFTLDQCKKALDEALSYYPDEFGDDDDGGNCGNLLTEINRIAHFKQALNKMKSPKKRRFF